jgi:hypothetical protein
VGLPAKSLTFYQAPSRGWLPVLVDNRESEAQFLFQEDDLEACCQQQVGLAPMLQLSSVLGGANNR